MKHADENIFAYYPTVDNQFQANLHLPFCSPVMKNETAHIGTHLNAEALWC